MRPLIFPLDKLRAPYILLEDRLTPGRPARLYRDPVAVIRCDDAAKVDAAFDRLEIGMAGGLHAAGLFSYELGYALEPKLSGLMPDRRETPLLWFGLFSAPQIVESAALDAVFAALPPPPPITGLSEGSDRAAHMARIARVLDLIGSGEAYQVNLTFPIRFRYAGDPLSLYAALRARQPVAHGGVVALENEMVLSVSPELWVEVEGDRATTRPMKGTSPRGGDPHADQRAREGLAADPKQRAENLMIVDLLRNDLARIAAPGAVRVPDLFTVETYPGFHAMTSTVTARLEPGRSLRERVSALFPCGSVVGAPKIRAAEIIRDLETEPRGFYTGALGAIAPNGDMAFNVAIRTAVLTPGGDGRYGVGGGIVADSDPGAEYDEARLKGRVLTDLEADYDLFETFRWEAGTGFVRLALHLDRLAVSARRLRFAFDRAQAQDALQCVSRAWNEGASDLRVRLALSRPGKITITHAQVSPAPARVLRVGLAEPRLDPGDPFLRHKTTRRAAHDDAFATAAAAGLDEALFLNRRGEIAEATRNSIFVEIDGRLATPPLSAGALPGILRGVLLSTGRALERPLTLPDLRRAPRAFLGNSLYALREFVLI
jgi:para-aminobenzoate synthetase/4-amino-4-deoxychorismate lyase